MDAEYCWNCEHRNADHCEYYQKDIKDVEPNHPLGIYSCPNWEPDAQ